MSSRDGKTEDGLEKAGVLYVTLTKSPIGYSQRQKRTVRALGLRRMNQTVEKPDTAVVRGMISKVSHLVAVKREGALVGGDGEATRVETG